jgi:hypothetical protein
MLATKAFLAAHRTMPRLRSKSRPPNLYSHIKGKDSRSLAPPSYGVCNQAFDCGAGDLLFPILAHTVRESRIVSRYIGSRSGSIQFCFARSLITRSRV